MTILRTLRHACGLDERRCGACFVPYDTPGKGTDGDLCPECRAAVRLVRPLCVRCGLPLASSAVLPDGAVCASCLADPPPWRKLYAVGPHEGLLRDLLLRAKYRGDRSACRLLGRLLAERIKDDRTDGGLSGPWPELLLPMPLHPARLSRRGFNQCQEMAEPVGRLLHIPRRPALARRVVPTRPQTGLPRAERVRNFRQVFTADPAVRDRRLLILDDTVTTGTTLRRLADCLLRAGAAEVTAAVIAVALPHVRNDPFFP